MNSVQEIYSILSTKYNVNVQQPEYLKQARLKSSPGTNHGPR